MRYSSHMILWFTVLTVFNLFHAKATEKNVSVTWSSNKTLDISLNTIILAGRDDQNSCISVQCHLISTDPEDEFESDPVVFTNKNSTYQMNGLDSTKEYVLLCELFREDGEREEWSHIISAADRFSKSVTFDNQEITGWYIVNQDQELLIYGVPNLFQPVLKYPLTGTGTVKALTMDGFNHRVYVLNSTGALYRLSATNSTGLAFLGVVSGFTFGKEWKQWKVDWLNDQHYALHDQQLICFNPSEKMSVKRAFYQPNATHNRVVDYAINPISGYLYVLMESASKDNGSALCRVILPVHLCSAGRSSDSKTVGDSYFSEFNEWWTCVDLPSKSVSIASFLSDGTLHLLFENGEIGVYTANFTNKSLSSGLTSCPSMTVHLPIKNYQLTRFPDGYLIVSQQVNKTVQLSDVAGFKQWQCNELFHLEGANSLSLSRGQLTAAETDSPPENVQVIFLETKARINWQQPRRSKDTSPTGWQNWSYLIELIENDHVVQLHVTRETRFQLKDLKRGTCYHLRIGVITSPVRVFLYGCTLVRAPEKNIAVVLEDSILTFAYADDQFYLSAKLGHPFHRQILGVRIRFPLLWVHLVSGDVYVGRLDQQFCVPGAMDSRPRRLESTAIKANVTNWKQLLGVEADTIEVDYSTNEVYFIKRGNKWLYRWIPGENEQSRTSSEDFINGQVILMWQTAVEDIQKTDSNSTLLILTRGTTDGNRPIFSLSFEAVKQANQIFGDRLINLGRIQDHRMITIVTSYANLTEYVSFDWSPTVGASMIWHWFNLTSGTRMQKELTHFVNSLYQGTTLSVMEQRPQVVALDQSGVLLGAKSTSATISNKIVWTNLKGNATGDFRQLVDMELHSVLAVRTMMSVHTCLHPSGFLRLTNSVSLDTPDEGRHLGLEICAPKAGLRTIIQCPMHVRLIGLVGINTTVVPVKGYRYLERVWCISGALDIPNPIYRSLFQGPKILRQTLCGRVIQQCGRLLPNTLTTACLDDQPDLEWLYPTPWKRRCSQNETFLALEQWMKESKKSIKGQPLFITQGSLPIYIPNGHLGYIHMNSGDCANSATGSTENQIPVVCAEVFATRSMMFENDHGVFTCDNQTTSIKRTVYATNFIPIAMAVDPLLGNTFYLVECYKSQMTNRNVVASSCEIRQRTISLRWLLDVNTNGDQTLPEIIWTSKAVTKQLIFRNLPQVLSSVVFIRDKGLILEVNGPVCLDGNSACSVNLDLGPDWIAESTINWTAGKEEQITTCSSNLHTKESNLYPPRQFSVNWKTGVVLEMDRSKGYVYAARFSPAVGSIHGKRIGNNHSLVSCFVTQPLSDTYPNPNVLTLHLSESSNTTLTNNQEEGFTVKLLLSSGVRRMNEMITTLRTITNDLEKHKSVATVTVSTRGGTVGSSGGGGRSDDASAGKDNDSLIYPEVPALLIVKPVQCKAIPGHFVLSCYRREIEFTWIPPQIPIKKAMVKFKQHDEPKFNTMSDYGWGPSGPKVRNHTLTELRPNTVYEFGLNLIYQNDTFEQFPPTRTGQICACQTHTDVPEKPQELRYHYLKENDYSLEWVPGEDNGEPIITYNLKAIQIHDKMPLPNATWQHVVPYNLTDSQLNFTLPSNDHNAVQLRAVNKVGMSEPSYITIQPPVKKVSGSNSVYSSIFEPLNHVTGVLTYSLLSIGVVLLLLLMIIVFIYRRRRTDCKAGKHPFLISFNPSRRIHSGSGNDSFGLGGGSDLTTSGVPLDLSTLEPLWNQEVNSLYGIGKSDLISFEQVTQISAANIRFQRYIGCGAFGKVWEGWLHVNDIDGDRFEKVALKVRNRKSLTEAEFRREATLMHRYQHANIVRFFGVSFDSPGQQCLVLEMMDQGNLRDYLHRARPRIAPNVAANMFAAAAICAAGGGSSGAGDGRNGSEGSSMNTSTTSTAAGCGTTTASNVITLTAQLDLPALIGIMRDIAQGCRYLEEQHFVHRDIAARNCLVSHSHPSGRIVKLCDFGLARDIYKNDCYLKRNEPKLPVRWMSPEAIRDGLFTTKSDVWAFAVTCWEVMTLGADPFYGRANLDVMNLVIGGHVLGRPENCPDELYNQMLQCWSRFSEMRPSFVDLTEKMNEFVQRSHDSGSVFAGAFIVSLPLPRSLPDSSCQPMFACSRDERQPQQPELVRPNNNNKCQRRASLNEYHSNSQLSKDNTFTLPQCHTMTRGRHNSQRVARQPPNLPVCHEQDTGCANFLGPRSMDLSLPRPGSMRNHSNTCGPSGSAVGGAGPRVENRTYLVGSAATTGYECALSDPSTEQTTLVTTTTGTDGATQGSVNGTAVLDPTLFTTPSVSGSAVGPGVSSGPGHGGRLNAPEKTVYQQQDTGHETRPVSLFDNPCSPGNTSHPQSGFYRSLSYRNPQGINQGQMVNINRSMTQSQTHSAGVDQPNGSGSTTGPSLAAYWLVGTGGGVDSQGYERPTWTSASPSMHGWMNSQTQLLNQRASGSVILKTSMEPIGLQDLTNEQKTLRGTISG